MSTAHSYSIAPAWGVLLDRCAAMGLYCWRTESGGAIIDEPAEPGVVSLWLRSSPVHRLVRAVGAEWAKEQRPTLREVAPGLWLLPLALEHRRRRHGVAIAAALGRDLIDTPLLEEACRAAGMDVSAVRVAIGRVASFDRSSATRTARMLEWMASDHVRLGEQESTLGGFTTELSQSYETIDMLYTLSRSMRNLDQPMEFFGSLVDRLHDTMPYAWLATRFTDDRRALGPLCDRLLVRGSCPLTRQQALEQADALLAQLAGDPRTTVVDAHAATGARVLAQPVIVSGRLAGVLFCGERRGDDPQVSSYDMQLMEAAAGFTAAFLENARLYRDQEAMFLGSLRALTAAIDAKDRYTCGHSERVAYLARELALAAGMTDAQAQRVHLSGLLHDVGKIGVPEAVLCKSGRLTEAEFELVKKHPSIGHDILKGIPMLEDILPGVLHHHERFDGNGYPAGLAGPGIPVVARMLALADTFDAMSSTRSYRGALPREKVLEEIRSKAAQQFDPELTRVFLSLDLAAYDEMVARHTIEFSSTPLPKADEQRAAA